MNQNENKAAKSIDILALTKAFKEAAEKKARAEVNPGSYTIDTWVHLKGSVNVGEDYDQQIWQTSKPLALLALLADKLNEDTLRVVISEYVAALDDAGMMVEIEAKGPSLKDRTDEAIKAVKAETKKPCKGKVTTKLEVEFADGVKA